jgi:hypothetical protein
MINEQPNKIDGGFIALSAVVLYFLAMGYMISLLLSLLFGGNNSAKGAQIFINDISKPANYAGLAFYSPETEFQFLPLRNFAVINATAPLAIFDLPGKYFTYHVNDFLFQPDKINMLDFLQPSAGRFAYNGQIFTVKVINIPEFSSRFYVIAIMAGFVLFLNHVKRAKKHIMRPQIFTYPPREGDKKHVSGPENRVRVFGNHVSEPENHKICGFAPAIARLFLAR